MDDYVYLEKDVRAHQEEAAASKEIDRMYNTIRIYHECEGRIEKIRPEDHRLASRGLASDDKR